MKKTLTLILSLLLLFGCFAACGSEEVPQKTEYPTVPSNKPTESTAEPTETTAAPSESESDDPETEQTEAPVEPNAPLPEFAKDATIEETVLYDEGGLKITATGLEYGNYSVDVEFSIENNSDKDYTFLCGSSGYCCNAINGYMIEDGYMSCDVAAGKKAKDSISFDYDSLRLFGIFEIAHMELGFSMYDDDYEYIYSGLCKLDTSAADSYDYGAYGYENTITGSAAQKEFDFQTTYFTNEPMFEQNSIRVDSACFIKNSSGEYALFIEATNMSSEIVYFQSEDIRVNGLCIQNSNWSTDTVTPGNTLITMLDFSAMIDQAIWNAFELGEVVSANVTFLVTNEEDDEVCDPIELLISIPNAEPQFSKNGKEIYNDNGIGIYMMDIVEDSSEYSDDLSILLLVENRYGDTVIVREDYGSFSINGYMAECSTSYLTLQNESWSILEIKLYEYMLEDTDVTVPDDIQSFDITLEIRTPDYDSIDSPTLSVTME